MSCCAKIFQNVASLEFVEAGQRRKISCAVAVFRVKSCQCLRRMISSEHHTAGMGCDSVLHFHALTGLLVSFHKIAQFVAAVGQRLNTCINSFFNIDCCFNTRADKRSEEHTSELQSRFDLVCRLLLEKKKKNKSTQH